MKFKKRHIFIRPLSIQARLTLLNVVLLSLLWLVVALAQYFLLNNYLDNRLDSSLRATARPLVERRLGEPPPRDNQAGRNWPQLAADLTSKETLAIIIERNGKVTTTSGNFSATQNPVPVIVRDANSEQTLEVSPPTAALLEKVWQGESNVSYDTEVAGWGKALAVAVPLRQNAARPGQPDKYQPGNAIIGLAILVGSTTANQDVLTSLLLINLACFGVVTGLIALLSPPMARSSLRPLRRMIKTTQEIAQGDLSRRVQLETGRDEIGQLAASFNRMVEQLEALFKAQRQLVADASHELRTPLTAIKGSLEVLLLGGVARDPEAANQLMKTMHQEIARLTRLVNDMLTLSKLDRKDETALQAVQLAPLLDEVIASFRLMIQQSGKELQLKLVGLSGSEAILKAYPDWLKQVLYNLLDNALKFSPPGGIITLELLPPVALGQGQRYYGLVVRDQGEGIAPSDLPYIFDRFYRSDSSRLRQKGGSGLGLAIVRSLMEAQQGSVRAESQPGQGAAFFIYLPVVTSERFREQ